MMSRISVLIIGCLLLTAGCIYKKGDAYRSVSSEDTLSYMIASKGSGMEIMKKAWQLKKAHESKGNLCLIQYVTDSASVAHKKAILLTRVILPNMKDDMLTKGYFGTFTSKQEVTIKIVSRDQLEKYFIREP